MPMAITTKPGPGTPGTDKINPNTITALPAMKIQIRRIVRVMQSYPANGGGC